MGIKICSIAETFYFKKQEPDWIALKFLKMKTIN